MEHAVNYVLVMGMQLIGCLPDTVGGAVRSFSQRGVRLAGHILPNYEVGVVLRSY